MNERRKATTILHQIEKLIEEENFEELKKIDIRSINSPEIAAKLQLLFEYEKEINHLLEYETNKSTCCDELLEKLNELLLMKRKLEKISLKINVGKLNEKISQLEIESSILHAIGTKNEKFDINEYLLTKSIEKADSIQLNSDIVQHGKEILEFHKNFEVAFIESKKSNEITKIEEILKSTPQYVKSKFYLTVQKATNEIQTTQYQRNNLLSQQGSQKQIIQSTYDEDDDDLFYDPKSNQNQMITYTNVELIKMGNFNHQKELDRQLLERNTNLIIAQQKKSDTQMFEIQMKKIFEQSKFNSFKEEELNLEREKFEKKKEIHMEKENERIYQNDMNNLYLLVLIQLSVSFLIYAFGSFEVVLQANCSFKSNFCLLRMICIQDLSFFASVCETSIIIGLGIGTILFLMLISYFQLGSYGILLIGLLIGYFKILSFNFIWYFVILVFVESMAAYLMSGRRWMFQGREFKFLLNVVFSVLSSFAWFYLTVYLAAGDEANCTNIWTWNKCAMIEKLLRN